MSNDYESNWNPTNNKPKTKRKRLEEIEFLLHFQTPTSRNKKRLTTLWLYMHNIYIHIYIYRIVPDSICHDNTTNECRMQFSAKNLFCPMTFTFIPACLHIQHTLCTYYSFCSVACNLELRKSATRESCLGLGRNGNRNRMGDGRWAMGVGVEVGGVPRLGALNSRPKRKRKLWHFGSQVESV